MEASRGTEARVIRLADGPDAIELDTNNLLGRLEAQAEENGRLRERAELAETKAQAERDSRRRISDVVKRERRAAEGLHKRTEAAEALCAAQEEELERLRGAVMSAEQQIQANWMELTEMRRELALRSRPMWRKLLRRPTLG